MRRNAVRIVLVSLVAATIVVAAIDSSAGAQSASKVKAEPSEGCAATVPEPPGEREVSITTSAGVERLYFQHVPPAHDGTTPVPMVVDFHGIAEGPDIHKIHTMLGELGDEDGFVTVTPRGLGARPGWDTRAGSEDVVFVGEMLDELERTLCLDLRRVHVTGLSLGAIFLSTLICEYSDRFASAAPVAGVRDPTPCDQERPVPLVAFHGTEDQFLAFEGGIGPAVEEVLGDGSAPPSTAPSSEPPPPSVPEIVAAVADRNDCRAKPKQKKIGSDVVLVSYRCPDDADVELYRINGGGHAWPGSEFSQGIESVVGFTTFTIDANTVMWDFFQQHPLRDS